MNIFLFFCCLLFYFFYFFDNEKEGIEKYVYTFLIFAIPFGSYHFILKPNWAQKDQLEMELNQMEKKKSDDKIELNRKTHFNEIAKRIISFYRDKDIDFTNYSSTIKNLRSDVKNYYVCIRCEVDSSLVYLDDVGSYVILDDEYKFDEKFRSQAIFIELHSMKFQWKEQEIYYEDYEGGVDCYGNVDLKTPVLTFSGSITDVIPLYEDFLLRYRAEIGVEGFPYFSFRDKDEIQKTVLSELGDRYSIIFE